MSWIVYSFRRVCMYLVPPSTLDIVYYISSQMELEAGFYVAGDSTER